eukprot:TRINITY_DN5425_c0_g1_i1.p1 TRINITY_DN5425_c0_g1~~TRINITY_DN5425_c0_g1_i1.p1  ORF type:complete len:331 (+),score=109.67 TRINITY_DN5425_c0_g1_i1:47-1039(+)
MWLRFPEHEEEVMIMGNVLCGVGEGGGGGGGGRCFCCYQAQKRQRRASYTKNEVKALTDLISVSECVAPCESSVLCSAPSAEDRSEKALGAGGEDCLMRNPLEERLPPPVLPSESEIHLLFESYRDSEDAILSEGIQRLCSDLDLAPEEFRVLILAWKCRAERMCLFSHSEFLEGLKALDSDNLSSLRLHLSEVSARVNDVSPGGASLSDSPQLSYNASFRDLYRFTYKFGLEPGQRILPIDMAISLWMLVFSQRGEASLGIILPKWFNFLRIHSFIRSISKDTWNMFLNFLEIVGSDLDSYDDTEAWPSLLDDFVEYEREATTSSPQPS